MENMITIPQSKITEDGKKFIRKYCNGNSTTLLRGRNSNPLTFTDNINVSDDWVSDPAINGGIHNNGDLANKLIEWYDKYCGIAGIDPNFLVAQTSVESGYFKVWAYPNQKPNAENKSSAMGLTQFLMSSFYEWSLNPNKTTYEEITEIKFTSEEKERLKEGVESKYDNPASYGSSEIYRKFRKHTFQNVVNNPELMVKMQVKYMAYIAKKYDNLASSALLGYNRGHDFVKKSYLDSVNDVRNRKDQDYTDDGIDYVKNIFNILYDSFGYRDLKMKDSFDSYQAGVDNSHYLQ